MFISLVFSSSSSVKKNKNLWGVNIVLEYSVWTPSAGPFRNQQSFKRTVTEGHKHLLLMNLRLKQ